MYAWIFRHLISRIEAERAHRWGVRAVRYGGWILRFLRHLRMANPLPVRPVVSAGITFPGHLGLAAGMDKNATAVQGFADLGFSFVEIGTVTPLSQPGNERPRAWRHPGAQALRNRMGFNNDGADAVARRLAHVRRTRAGERLVIGVNIGKNKATAVSEASRDYAYAARTLAPYADYLVVNVSSPNTPGLRDLQAVQKLRPILEATILARNEVATSRGPVPVLVKISPDISATDLPEIASLVNDMDIAGVVATNTTIDHDYGPGGLSGRPLREPARAMVESLRSLLGSDACIIGVGGIASVEDAQAMLDSGATLVQAYTGFVYGGPLWPAQVNRALGLKKP